MKMKSLAIKSAIALLAIVAFCGSLWLYLEWSDPMSGRSSFFGVAATNEIDGNELTGSSVSKSRPAIPLNSGQYKPREILDSTGYSWVLGVVKPWPREATLQEVASHFKGAVKRSIDSLTVLAQDTSRSEEDRAMAIFARAGFQNFEGDPIAAYEDLCESRKQIEKHPQMSRDFLYTVIYFQGLSGLRRGENENCIMCRGESSCILPISLAAQHKNPEGSEIAIKHFTEYLDRFPEDGEVRWLLNVAYMTLGKHPELVPKKYLVELDVWEKNEFDIGRFRDIGHLVGLNRFNQAGGGIMEDFDNDGRLDIAVSTFDPTSTMALYKNIGNGKFDDVTTAAGVANQLGGLNCMQTDYNNDGWMDVFIVRGAWLPSSMAIRPTLLKNNGDMTFTDVTEAAGLKEPVNSISACWADYDNDGWLDVFVCCERQQNRLYHNNKNGTFSEVAIAAGLAGPADFFTKGANWIDFDNDGYQDIFMTHLSNESARLYRNDRNGTFTDVSAKMGITGPMIGFACWTWDYDNDGWQDIFATCYDRDVGGTVRAMIGQPHTQRKNALWRNNEGKGFQDKTVEAGLDHVFFTMGSNFGDFDNDGFLDMYLGTGDPSLGSLVPNRMFKNVAGNRFSEITVSSGTGHLQKGHGVACGDWNADGNVDIFIEMGGAVNGDRYHNILFQNPGNDNNWVTLKLVGTQSNRAAIGARITVTIAGSIPKKIRRHVSSGGSFGANPLEQTIGIGDAESIDSVEIFWPTSGARQVFQNVPTKAFIEVTEGESAFKVLTRSIIEAPSK